MLYFHRPGLTAIHQNLLTQVRYTLPFSFNENPFQLEWVIKYSQNVWQANLTLAVTAESHPPSACNNQHVF